MLDRLDPFRRQAVALALARMLGGERFDVCTLRKALDAAGADDDATRADVATLRLFHGVRFADLPAHAHAALVARTVALVDPTTADAPDRTADLLDRLADAAGFPR